MTEDEIKREIALAFEYSYRHDDWVNPLDEALAGLTAEEARWAPSPRAKSIWDIVLHLAVWNENIVERIRSGENLRPTEGAWPEPPEVQDAAAWDAAQKRLSDSLEAIRVTIEAIPLATIQASPYGLADLMCRFTHMGYHLGQITKLRERLEETHPTD